MCQNLLFPSQFQALMFRFQVLKLLTCTEKDKAIKPHLAAVDMGPNMSQQSKQSCFFTIL